MEQILDAPTEVEKKLNYAGFWIRGGAYLLDGILLAFVNYIITSVFIENNGSTSIMIAVSCFQLLIGVGYFTGMESSSMQATLGKMAVGIKVGDQNGEQLSLGNALGRYVAKLFLCIFTLTISLMWAGWDERNQALHDKVAGTLVFYAK
jgi:uncharacterized RDD family membrane protein YckC